MIISLDSLECQNNSPILINHHRTDLGMYVLSTHSPSRKFKFHTKVFILVVIICHPKGFHIMTLFFVVFESSGIAISRGRPL